MKLTFGAAYFFTDNYLKASGKTENKRQLLEHIAQKTNDWPVLRSTDLSMCESAYIIHPKFGEGYAVLTNKDTEDLNIYKRQMRDVYVDVNALQRTILKAESEGHLQVFDQFA